MELLLLSLTLGFGIGALLGLLGGGGSILTVPALVYLIGQQPQAAITASLAIVGANSAVGAFFHSRQGTLNLRVALLFGSAGMVAAYFAASISKHFDPTVLMTLFAGLMLVVGVLMLIQRNEHTISMTEPAAGRVLAAGAGVGLLTGVLGVGGGFLIVPALVMLIGLPVQQAVGTSLIIIAMNSLAGFLGHLGGLTFDFTLIIAFVTAGVAGTLAGSRLAVRLRGGQLKSVFAVFVIFLAIFLLIDNLPSVIF